MTWRVSGNLVVIMADVRAHLGPVTIGTIGDTAHQTEVSDHNPDSRGIVCAIDVMFPVGPNATAIVDAARGRSDLAYIIHNRIIYSASRGWAAAVYTGSDPHINHVHLSSLHTTAADQTRTHLAWKDNSMANADDVMLFLHDIFNGFPAAGTPEANLMAAWVSGNQATQQQILAALTKLQASTDALTKAVASLSPTTPGPHHFEGIVD